MATTRRIGELEVSVAGLGCNNFGIRIDEKASKAVVDAAIDVGVTHFDTADIYGGTLSEEFLGRALGSRRADVVVATKFGMLAPPEGLEMSASTSSPGNAARSRSTINRSDRRSISVTRSIRPL